MINRRSVLKALGFTASLAAARNAFNSTALAQAPAAPAPAPSGPFTLPPLGYDYDALEPFIDATTMHLHHDKHHAAYVNNLNIAIAKHPDLGSKSITELVSNLDVIPEDIRTAVRNQGGGHSNHSLFWLTLSAKGGVPKSDFAQAVTEDLGGLDKLKAEMAEQGGKLFGSGWVWLVLDGGKHLTILTLPNQDSPLTEGHYPLFGIDVWEHAYYLKYKNVRADYITAIWSVVNWDFVSDRYSAAMKS